MSTIRLTWVGVLIVLVGSVGAQGQNTATPRSEAVDSSVLSSYPYPELVLTSGEHLPYVRYSITGNRVEVHTPSGKVRVFDRDKLDFEATLRTARQRHQQDSSQSTKPLKRHADPRAGLTAMAGGASLKLPDPNQPIEHLKVDLSKANVIEVKPQGAFAGSTNGNDEDASDTPDTEAVAGQLSDLRNARQQLEGGLREVDADCSGYTVGQSSSCGKSGVVSRRFTAACKDAVTRARAKVAPVRDAFARLLTQCRKSGMTPGELRKFLRNEGLNTLDAQLRATDAELDAWQKGTRD